jgi:membrane protease YdiL (CAAX protease family)
VNLSRDSTGRIRAIWRILSFVFVFFGVTVGFEIGIRALEAVVPISLDERRILEGITYCAAAIFATWYMLRYVEKRDWSMVWLDKPAWNGRALTFGALVGGLTIGIPSLLLWGGGWLRMTGSVSGSFLRATLVSTSFLLPAAFLEELLDRGYPFAVIREAAGPVAAVVLTSAVFGLLHSWNPGANAQSITVVALSGIFLGIVVLVTRSLYAASAAHFAWNWVMAVPLHTPVSGNALPMPDYRIVDAGPDWATGGQWGPESGAPAAVAMLLVIAYLMRGRRGQIFARPIASPVISAASSTESVNG